MVARTGNNALIFPGPGAFHLPLAQLLESQGWQLHHAQGRVTQEEIQQMDLIWCNWADRYAVQLSGRRWPAKLVVHVRSYEAYSGFTDAINWSHVDHVCYTADHIRDRLPTMTTPQTHVPDCIDLTHWPRVERQERGWNMAVVGRVINDPKNVTFAVQLAYEIPHATVWIRGPEGDPRLEDFIQYHQRALGDRLVRDYPPTTAEWWASPDMNRFYEKMDYILSPSYHESTHMALLEGMAKGCIPLVQDRAGAVGPPGCRYRSMKEAVDKATTYLRRIEGTEFRAWVAEHRSIERQRDALGAVVEAVS